MKNLILIGLLFFAVLTTNAQTDSVYRADFVKKVNEYRKGVKLKPILLNHNLNRAAEVLSKKGNAFKNEQGTFNKDSVRKVLRMNGIHDYQFDITENNTNPKGGFLKGVNKISELQATHDSLFNAIGATNFNGKELIFMSKHYIDFESEIRYNLTATDYFKPYENQKQTFTIYGSTLLENLTVCVFEKGANVEADMPMYKKILIKKGNLFVIELDVTTTNSRIPFIVSIVDTTGSIISQFNLSNL